MIACASDPVRLTRSQAIDTNPSWSPDGKQLAFTSSRSGRPNVYVMALDGSNVRRISFEGDYNDGASWQNGRHPYRLCQPRGQSSFRIAVDQPGRPQNAGSSTTGSGQLRGTERISPDGRRILFTVRRGKQSQVYVMNDDGSDWRQLTHEGNSSGADWSNFKKQVDRSVQLESRVWPGSSGPNLQRRGWAKKTQPPAWVFLGRYCRSLVLLLDLSAG